MPILTLPLEIGGAIIDVGFAVSGPRLNALKAANMPVPTPVIVRALVDTGASCTCLDPTVIAQLSLAPKADMRHKLPCNTTIQKLEHYCQIVVIVHYQVQMLLLDDSPFHNNWTILTLQ